jgi:hypothetical protein
MIVDDLDLLGEEIGHIYTRRPNKSRLFLFISFDQVCPIVMLQPHPEWPIQGRESRNRRPHPYPSTSARIRVIEV